MNTTISDPPVLRYRSGPNERDEKTLASKIRPLGQVFRGISWLSLFIVLAVWAVVGAVFWIPLLLRALITFSINLVEAVFEGQKPVRAARILRDAVSFYHRGFQVAVEMVVGKGTEEDRVETTTEYRLLQEVLWAILVWYFLLLLLGWIQASPADLWDWFFSIPWGDYFGDLVQRFKV